MTQITEVCSMEVRNGSFVVPRIGSQQVQIAQSVAGGGVPGKATAAVSPGSALDFTALTAMGRCRIVNMDDTNLVNLCRWTGSANVLCIELRPGEPNQFRLVDGLEYRLISAVGGEEVWVFALED